jgi:hypothetical protein
MNKIAMISLAFVILPFVILCNYTMLLEKLYFPNSIVFVTAYAIIEEEIEASIYGEDTVNSGDTVRLTAEYSQVIFDDETNVTLPAEDEVEYEWEQTGGPSINYDLNDRGEELSFQPSVDTETGFTFMLTVHGDSKTDSVSKTVTVKPVVIPPVVDDPPRTNDQPLTNDQP